jgi:DNA-binding transcriptional MerR regulator
MSITQFSLFDFEPAPSEKKQEEKVVEAVEIKQEAIVINEAPIEVEFVAPKSAFAEPVIEEPTKKNNRGRIKLAELEANIDLIDVPNDEELFQKKYYSIGLVAKMFKVNISLIRFWEKEFDILKPKLNGKGDRHFRPEDVKNIKQIYHLLRAQKYTIEGARDFLKKNKKSEESFALVEDLKKIQLFLNDLKLSL